MRCVTLVVCFTLALLVTSIVQAGFVTIDSTPFSLGYGYTSGGADGAWDTGEITSGNTPTTQGGFTFSPAPTAYRFTNAGPKFTNRVLGDSNYPTETDYCAEVGNPTHGDFTVPITASYTGPAPGDASSTPDYHLTLEITKVSVYATAYTGYGSTSVAWQETTSGHTATQGAATPILSDDTLYYKAATYTPVVWNPDDYSVAISGLNGSLTRTFGIVPGALLSGEDLRYVDGLEVEGVVHLSYNAVPEPSAIVLLTSGLAGLLAYAWRRRR
jgi:hypothetical protein